MACATVGCLEVPSLAPSSGLASLSPAQVQASVSVLSSVLQRVELQEPDWVSETALLLVAGLVLQLEWELAELWAVAWAPKMVRVKAADSGFE